MTEARPSDAMTDKLMPCPNCNDPDCDFDCDGEYTLSDDKLSGLVDELVAAAWQEGGPDAVERLEKAKANVRSTIETLQQQLRVRDEALKAIRGLIPKHIAAWGTEQEIADICDNALSTPEGSDR